MDKKITRGAVVAFLGLYWLLSNMGVIVPIQWNFFWPGVVILIGLWIIFRNKK